MVLSSGETWIRPRPGSTGLRRDLALAVAVAVFAVAQIEILRSFTEDFDLGWRGAEGYLWAAALGLALAGRRRYPISTLLVCAALFFATGVRLPAVMASLGVQAALFMSMYAAWAWARDRRRLLVWTVVVVAGMFAWVTVQLVRYGGSPIPKGVDGALPPVVAAVLQTFLINVIYFFGAVAWGLVAWRAARQRAELRVQAERLAAEQAERARQAVANERVRIARELHDVVAHHVSGIGVHAAGARRMLDRDPAATTQALGVIETASRNAVLEMHQLVTLLREADPDHPEAVPAGDRNGTAGSGAPPDARSGDAAAVRSAAGQPAQPRGPQPGLADLDALVSTGGAGGSDVRLRRVGTPFDVPETVGLSLYRIVQESLANVRRHARGATADVVLRYVEDPGGRRFAEVEVIDDGRGTPGPTEEGHVGWGLAGIRERAALHDGFADIGPRPDGGFRVRVRLPAEVRG